MHFFVDLNDFRIGEHRFRRRHLYNGNFADMEVTEVSHEHPEQLKVPKTWMVQSKLLTQNWTNNYNL